MRGRPLMLPGVTPVMEASAATLETTLREIAGASRFGPGTWTSRLGTRPRIGRYRR